LFISLVFSTFRKDTILKANYQEKLVVSGQTLTSVYR